MEISINNQPTAVSDGSTVGQIVIGTLKLNPAGMAIAINDKVVPKAKWDTTTLQPSDRMLVIKASKGG